MSMQQILEVLRRLDDVVEVAPVPGSDAPPVSWGDHFFYVAPQGTVAPRAQPFATIITKDYPGDDLSKLDRPGCWRLNLHIGRSRLRALHEAKLLVTDDSAAIDRLIPHPVYERQGWVSIVNPGIASMAVVLELLGQAHSASGLRI